jgi:hypothetical protein
MYSNDGIENMMLEQIKEEKLHWRAVLTRNLAVVQFLAEINGVFLGRQKIFINRTMVDF